MKRSIGIILLSAIVLISGCKTDSAGDGVNLLMDTAEAENVPEAVPERQSSEVCPETDENSAETVEKSHETAEISTEMVKNPTEEAEKISETTEKSTETVENPAETEEIGAEAVAEPVAQAEVPDGYITETTRFSGTLTGSDNSASKLEVEIDVPFGKQCTIDHNGRVAIYGASYYEDNSVYAYFADYEYYTDEIISEMLEGYRNEEYMQESEVTAEKTLDGADFYLHITRFYDDSGFTQLRSVMVEGTYILDNGHHFEWSYINRGEWDFDDFVSDAVKSLKSVKFTEYIPTQDEIDQAELDAIIEALIQAGEIQTEFPWRGEVADARSFADKTTLYLRNSDEPNVLDVTVSGENVTIRDMLNVHMLHTGVVGRFGSPVEVSGTSEGSVITFRVDKRNMKNVPFQNLIVLRYNEEDAWYDELPSKVDEAQSIVSAEANGDGCYLLADLYEWYSVWGFPIPEGSEHEIAE